MRADEGQFRALYAAALPEVYGFLRVRVGGNTALAEDLTADTFAAAVVEYQAGRAEIVTTSWLRTVARCRLIDHWRRERVAATNLVKLPGRSDVPNEADFAERELVLHALATLSSDERAALVLKHLDGYPVAEIAEALGRTPKATESLLGRARIAFRSVYTEGNR